VATLKSNSEAGVRGRVIRALLLCGLALLAAPAGGHARLLRAAPADKSVVKESPARVELWFNELLDVSFNNIEVYRAAEVRQKQRKNFVKSKPQVDAKDRTHIVAELEPLAPGEYCVEYRVLSRDGHTAPGRFSFRVQP